MQPMPALPSPPKLPQEVADIVDAIGNRLRTEILSLLAQDTLTAHDLASRTGADVTTMRRHLEVLENVGLVIGDPPVNERTSGGRGRKILWSTDHGRVREVGQAWIRYATADKTAS